MSDATERVSQILAMIERRIAYLDDCRSLSDWHGVRDAAADLERLCMVADEPGKLG